MSNSDDHLVSRFLGVRAPGAAIETSYPHFGAFTPDERAIGHGVRAIAGRPRGPARPAGAVQTTSTDIELVIPLDTYRYWT
ncbi:hypothetical protein [Nonomuraea sp. NPDC049625]|uniref:hypothetical protein n=1 Tax=Nonomuraea sp. NPDC049625 TaxID=3155775 RepID=UPI00343154E2